ncbi:MAG TPA: glycoside hydrolase family 15 protein [Marmoricola sp.]|nr:glycoside hydrolase family 15 protein [Marmoricola sp.]HNN47474.1 glycoside hydrolase family 15 protein [Marmoricola sp.]HNO39272.1 glycoside hydrolase family 15 protein [Marmoricola sp.]
MSPSASRPAPIEDYALLSDCRTAALVSRRGSIDWLCLPRFDSASIFARLLGNEGHGRWSLNPTDPEATCTRQYDGDSFVLITRWETSCGVAEVHDLMPMDHRHLDVVRRSDLIRRVVGISGEVDFEQHLVLRFDYARATPWVRQVGSRTDPAVLAIAGPDAVVIRGARLTATDHTHSGRITVTEGSLVDLSLTWFPSHHSAPPALSADQAITRTRDWWQRWADRITDHGRYHPELVRSLLVLRALTHHDTGGIVAAPTTSLPELIGGQRNWDYRYVWLRDAALTLEALIDHGFLAIAHHWRQWLLRAVAGDLGQLQIMYGVGGERDLPERELEHLPGYLDSAPARLGNAAHKQYQADVIGEVLVALAAARRAGLEETRFSWSLQQALVRRALAAREQPDHGIWEIRGEPRMFTHSRVMIWAALDRGVLGASDLGGPVAEWTRARDELRREIEEHAVSPGGYFTQAYGVDAVDAALLLLPQVGFCAADDPRMLATVVEIERTLLQDGLLLRYQTETGVDGLAGGAVAGSVVFAQQ